MSKKKSSLQNVDMQGDSTSILSVTEDMPKETKENSSSVTSTKLSPRDQMQLEYDKRDSEESKAQSNLAFKIFIILLILWVALILVSVIMKCLNIEEIKAVTDAISFCPNVLTTIIGFLFGARIYRKKL